MSFFEYFSDGTGLIIFIVVLLAILVGIGVAARRSSKKDYFGEILVPCSLIAFSMVFLAITFSFPSEEAGPSAVPLLWIFWTIVLCVAILWKVLRGKAKPDPESGRLAFLILVMVVLIGYYFTIQIIGYFLSSFLFLVLLMHIMAFKKKLIIYVVAVCWVVFSYTVFYRLLYIQLPLGYFEYYF
jgi:putative tricarboxylic transport membrane protein